MTLRFDRAFDPAYGRAVQVSPLIRRVTAENPGPFTLAGTNTHIVGRGRVAIVDPGPDRGAHVAALLDAVRAETVTHILVSHSHFDHTGAVRALADATGAPIVGCARIDVPEGGPAGNVDYSFGAEQVLADGERIDGPGWTLEAVATPGHLSNHLCFALPEEKLLLSGDHVMAWSTTVVTPPHGSMSAYRASLTRLLTREETVYLPAHGPALRDAIPFVRALIAHRAQRERAILERLAQGPATIGDIVEALYPDLAPALLGGAAASVRGHLLELEDRGIVGADSATDGPFFTTSFH